MVNLSMMLSLSALTVSLASLYMSISAYRSISETARIRRQRQEEVLRARYGA